MKAAIRRKAFAIAAVILALILGPAHLFARDTSIAFIG